MPALPEVRPSSGNGSRRLGTFPAATSASTLLPGALGPCVFLSEISCDVVKETWLTFPSYIHGCQDPSEIFHLLSFHHRFISHRPVLNLLHLAAGELLGSSCGAGEPPGVGSEEGH